MSCFAQCKHNVNTQLLCYDVNVANCSRKKGAVATSFSSLSPLLTAIVVFFFPLMGLIASCRGVVFRVATINRIKHLLFQLLKCEHLLFFVYITFNEIS